MAWELTGNALGSTGGFLGSTDAQPLIVRTGTAPSATPPERLRVTPEGRIGIGTATPQARLSVAGGGAVINNVAIGTDTSGVGYFNEHETVGAALPGATLRLQSPNGLAFHAGPTGATLADNERMTISPGGDVGIGKAPDAAYRVDVAGAVNATEVHRNGAPLVSSQWAGASGGAISYGGDVGIGTVSPRAKLSVAGGGATLNGVAIGTDVLGIDYPHEYETIGVTQPGFNLRLQSPNSIVFHTGDVPVDRMSLTEDGDLVIRKFPANDTTPSLTKLGLINRSAGGNETQWALYTAAIGGGWGVNPNAFEIWEYPATRTRFQIRPGGNTILAPAGGNVGIGTMTPRTTLEIRGSLTLEEGRSPVLFTGIGTSELNRHLLLINSPDSTSASGLKAGGVLVSDTYDYANPSKNDLIVKGNVGIGTTSPGFRLDVADRVRLRQGGSGSAGLWLYPTTPAKDQAFIGMRTDTSVGLWGNTGVGWGLYMDTGSGEVTIASRLGTGGWRAAPRTSGWGGGVHTWDVEAEGTMWSQHGYKQGSDARMKTNVAGLSSVLDKLETLRGVSFEWIGTRASAPQRDIGVIAQEVEEVFPELVSEHGEENLKAVDYSGLAGVLIEATKELKAENEALRSRIETLERG